MTQPQTLSVEYDELMARADELEQPIENIPVENPAAPCGLPVTREAAKQIALSADMMRLYLRGCAREWKSLAKSLREAAKAYQEVDETGEAAITNETSMLTITPASVSANDSDDVPFDPPAPLPMSAAFDYPYYEVRQAVIDIEAGDQGAAFMAFADEWSTFQLSLQEVAYRFRPFLDWDGDAREAVEANFEQQRQWISGMVQLCRTLAAQPQGVVDAQKRLRAASGSYEHDVDGSGFNPEEHPGPIDIANCDYWYKWYAQNAPDSVHYAIEWYQVLQERSEESLKLYVANASLPLPPVNPPMFASASGIPDLMSGTGGLGDLDLGDLGGGDGLSSGDGLSGLGGGLPTMPSLPSMPNGATPGAPVVPPLPSAGHGKPVGAPVKPASVGGAGGIGGAGLPRMPLQPWGNGGAATSGAAAAPGGGGISVPAAYAALGKGAGGGMGGGMPMGGAGGQNQNAAKGKRVQTEDAALYTEDRAWTEGVIGRRRAEASPARG
jgi:hypothetical protein